MIIDTHCHLYLSEFDADREDVLQRAMEAQVKKFMLPNVDSGSVDALLSLSKLHPDSCFPMMGLHPCSVKQDWNIEMAIIEKWLKDPAFKWFGIGETGLDYFWDKTFIDKQTENFLIHIKWAKQFHLPIIIHSRDALDDCIHIIKKNKDESLQGIFHCFSGSLNQAREIVEMGFYLGIGGVVTFKNGGLDKVLPEIALDNIVLETDSPYLAPVPFRGKRNESSYMEYVVKRISEIKHISEKEVSEITTQNAEKVYRFTL